jgi:hypothetical protein
MSEYEVQRSEYRASDLLHGRLTGDEPAPIELLADPDRGLYGVRAPPKTEAAE